MLRLAKRGLRTAQTFLPGLARRRSTLERYYRRVLRRPHDPRFAALRLLPPGPLYIDAGANEGQSIESIRLYHPNAPIRAFEPNPVLASRLKERYARVPGVEIEAVGLGREAGAGRLYVPCYRGYEFHALAAVSEEAATRWLRRDALIGFDERWLRVQSHPCQVTTLDRLQLAPYFIKIDTEGSDLHVLQGGQATLRRHRPLLMIESLTPAAEALELLAALEYEAFAFSGGSFRQVDAQHPNVFLVPRERRGLIARHLG